MTVRANLLVSKAPHFRAAASAQPARPASAHGAADEFALTVCDNLDSVDTIWRTFQERADCTVFQTFEWLSAWQRNIGARNGVVPRIVTVRDAQGAILCIMPLASVRHRLLNELVWLGSELCDYNAPLLAADFASRVDAATFQDLWRRVLQAVQANAPCDIVRLEKMPEMVGPQPNPMVGLPTILNPSGCYATSLAPTWDAFYAGKRSGVTRARDRGKRKRLAALGDIQFVTAQSEADALATLTVLVEQKSAALARRGIANMFARPGYADFYRDIAGNPQTRHLVHVGGLRVGRVVAATNLGLTFKGRYYYVLSSYTDGEMSRLGPGAAHLHELFRYAIDHRFTVFDFTIGDEPYKRDWCGGAQPLHDHLSVTGWRGAAAAAPLIALRTMKRAIKQSPLLWTWFSRGRALAGSLLRLGSDERP